ncbi:dipeptide ABC transporter ATP-binding protein [Nonomuraea sp. NPDC049309]|uniref:dipeptide ABC transporter ATP-binding protein n=1 Tax=Nonomuraea sp. NPDC049309 TaxID=3364350 RepID=UPI00371DC74D
MITLRRFVGSKGVVAGALVIVVLFLLGFLGPVLSPWTPTQVDYLSIRSAPSAAHWWGTNRIGQDIFAQTTYGLRKSLVIGLIVALFSTVLASLAGAAAGYLGGWTDRVLRFCLDLLLIFPGFLIISMVAPRLKGAGWLVFALLLGFLGWMISARIVRSMTLSLKERDFVRAAELMGVPKFRIIARHILPNVASFLIIDTTIAVGGAVMSETALSYFGFGIQPPDVSLGTLIADGTEAAIGYPWMFWFAAGLLIVFVLAVSLVGDGLRDALDPTSEAARPKRGTVTALPRAAEPPDDVVLSVRDLTVRFGDTVAADSVSWDLRRGEVLGIVGESGSGKSVTALAAMGLLPATATVTGSVRLGGTELIGADVRTLMQVRGARVAMVFQDPLSAFTPVYRIGVQIAEALRAHTRLSKEEAHARAVELLRSVGIPEPERRAESYPHEFSGGMRQRAMIAMAIANDPDVILADEPTTALDVTVQAQVLDLLRKAQRETGAALVLISHDLGVIAGIADRVAVMNGGKVVEEGPAEQVFARPRESYTKDLLAAVPRLDAAIEPRGPAHGAPLVEVSGLRKTFPLTRGSAFKRRIGTVYAVDGVDLTIRPGETLGLVGESGSGKTTTLFELLRMPEVRENAQIVFQDPMSSLDPRMTVGEIIAEPLRAKGLPADDVPHLLEQVGLKPEHASRFPHEFSGGQRQRIGIARALSVRPKLVVLDEPVSALDVTVQADILDLLVRLRDELNLAYLFVSHDLAVVRQIADRVSVMYLGRTVETGDTATVLGDPLHPYTKALISAVPIPDPAVERAREHLLLPGDPPSPFQRHEGCPFRGRCPVYAELPATDRRRCETEPPAHEERRTGHRVACHFPL